MFNSTPDRVWANLLFKVAFVPFVGLLLVLITSQTMSLQNHTSEEAGPNNSGAFVEVTTF